MEISFGEKIKFLREIYEITQTELGKALNMTQRKYHTLSVENMNHASTI